MLSPCADISCEGDACTSDDTLTCGACRQQFPLTDFITFVYHKVLGCAARPPAGAGESLGDVTAEDTTGNPRDARRIRDVDEDDDDVIGATGVTSFDAAITGVLSFI